MNGPSSGAATTLCVDFGFFFHQEHEFHCEGRTLRCRRLASSNVWRGETKNAGREEELAVCTTTLGADGGEDLSNTEKMVDARGLIALL